MGQNLVAHLRINRRPDRNASHRSLPLPPFQQHILDFGTYRHTCRHNTTLRHAFTNALHPLSTLGEMDRKGNFVRHIRHEQRHRMVGENTTLIRQRNRLPHRGSALSLCFVGGDGGGDEAPFISTNRHYALPPVTLYGLLNRHETSDLAPIRVLIIIYTINYQYVTKQDTREKFQCFYGENANNFS